LQEETKNEATAATGKGAKITGQDGERCSDGGEMSRCMFFSKEVAGQPLLK